MFKTIADLIYPAGKRREEDDAATTQSLANMRDDLLSKLGSAAMETIKLRANVSKLRVGLLITRQYAMDAYDVELKKLEAMSPRSKSRVAQTAVVEAVKSDLKQIADTLVATGDAGAAVKS